MLPEWDLLEEFAVRDCLPLADKKQLQQDIGLLFLYFQFYRPLILP
jgi:hypothetical protein